jgi:uncharacterized protein (TIGR03435 family)
MNESRGEEVEGLKWMTRRFLLVASLVSIAASAVSAQETGRLEFEVASIKLHVPSGANERSGIEENQGLIRVENFPLKAVIETAYGVKDYQFSGPSWLSSLRYDIVAKPPAGYKQEQFGPLLRSLLADRFRLTAHRESKQMSGYELVVTKSGSKLRESKGPRTFFTARQGLISGTRLSMGEFVNALASMLGSPAVDRTDLPAAYDVRLEWTPEQALLAPSGADRNAESGASLFTALNEQLGLRLRAKKLHVDVLIVDRMERTPTEN